MKYLRVLGARSAHRAVPGASQQGIGKCGADVVDGARLAVRSEREEIVAAPVRRRAIRVDARGHEHARRLVADVEQPEAYALHSTPHAESDVALAADATLSPVAVPERKP